MEKQAHLRISTPNRETRMTVEQYTLAGEVEESAALEGRLRSLGCVRSAVDETHVLCAAPRGGAPTRLVLRPPGGGCASLCRETPGDWRSPEPSAGTLVAEVELVGCPSAESVADALGVAERGRFACAGARWTHAGAGVSVDVLRLGGSNNCTVLVRSRGRGSEPSLLRFATLLDDLIVLRAPPSSFFA